MFVRICLQTFLILNALFSQSIYFDADSAYESIRYLSITTGPRIMGSPEENKALNWARDKFDAYGADTTFILPFDAADTRHGKYITKSGTAVGIFKGETDSSIVIGGHLDSAGPDYPGANDNASGTATVIELARLWSQRPHHYTMVFCNFGGEEVGLIGSRHFVKDYTGIDKVALMISADMGGTDSDITSEFETDSMQAPKWLVRDAFQTDTESKLNRLVYHTQYSTQNTLSSRGSGSDHMPFLNAGIAAIDFTSDVNDSPIHTQQDKIDYIDKHALGGYGNFIDHLLLKYQYGGLGHTQAGHHSFILWQTGDVNIYLPFWLLTTFLIITLVLGTGAFVYARQNRLEIQKTERVRFSGLKTFVIFIIILIFSQMGEAVIQFIKGYRYSWYLHVDIYLLYSFIWALGGLWVGLQLSRKWKFSPDPYVYSKRALIVLFMFTITAMFLKIRLAFYPAFMLFFFSISLFVSNKWFKSFLIIVSPLMMFLLFFNEEFTNTSRMSAFSGFEINDPLTALVLNGFLILILSLFFLPVLNALAYLVASKDSFKVILKKYRQLKYGIISVIIITMFGVYAGFLSPYNQKWKPAIHVNAEYQSAKNKSKLQIQGNEYFKDVTVTGDTLMEYKNTRTHLVDLPITYSADWITCTGNESLFTITQESVKLDSINFNWQIQSEQPYFRIGLNIRADTSEIFGPESTLPFSYDNRCMEFIWYGFQGDTLQASGSFKVVQGSHIIRRVNAEYDQLPVNLSVQSDLASVRYRTRVEFMDTLTIGEKSPESEGRTIISEIKL
ncbi:MAG: M28 family peptidase [Calditrichaceae bacterium]